jgi:2-polyprenyl-3-methyl-5-hydroxy-6-metoxy-1,4-benzoquinol methylase
MDEKQRKPRRLQGLTGCYNLEKKKVLDLGAGGGEYLKYFGCNSIGLEIGSENIDKAKKAGLKVIYCDLESEVWPLEGHSFDVIWCSNYFEHTLSPHKLLIKSRGVLNDDGLMIISVPLMNQLSNIISKIIHAWRGYLAADHVSFFTKKSVLLTIERGGFEIVDSYSSLILSRSIFFNFINRILPIFWFNVTVVARKRKNWNYPDKSHKNLVDNVIVFKD